MIKVALIGIGKTGRHIADEILKQDNMEIVSAICSPESKKNGMSLGDLLGNNKSEVKISTSRELESIIFKTKPDIAVDFSTPSATMENALTLSEMKINMVIGTTGFSKEDIDKLQSMSYKFNTGIVYAPNITLGVNVMMLLANIATTVLNNYDFQILEIHHKNKHDIPSGTALKLSQEIKSGLQSSGVFNKDIPVNAIRTGNIVGKHEILITGDNDQIKISHESFSRKAFASGAINAINYIYKKPGYYEMKDILDLKRVLYGYIDSLDRALC
ncbi:MAG: 4-hydroxy-tetrahydrodipicolinate reductase [Clostridium sp.]|jgi:4-hydroxy-tetrahydrodipicolinate reductase|uniref:4-hydroxy-tetrahydrodipicolinate reductase n=1 Tax=Clostridium sp. TaxID=1506 RepID=UPI0025BCCDED|nr:4-hydroxy-tetrahydrodipicolinate reductase [Clostridium sp.]MCH3963559.1 4-hydroxy-tetrahydrodipicolinate reductase [Clostridium sp.]MCI1714700.1 4-hydroxy-tetrahydrodipicolinate reductase [Clostridium sp.]MCI1799111.1 4-hydroxy-tetrahydrodipicolinate reductase [Clostridium sp.]MCI1812883.1 4-hydroxy-tetrahydrodipicolinate reductase [Clostridium sp.]MCI1869773.1 4-hydroxy-tetrahydrodipicolinate reductase [Clostridium sp.]